MKEADHQRGGIGRNTPVQGNRVNELCCEEADQEAAIPGGDLAPQAEGILGSGVADQVVGQVPEGRRSRLGHRWF